MRDGQNDRNDNLHHDGIDYLYPGYDVDSVMLARFAVMVEIEPFNAPGPD